jgi:hypothetical protein
MRSQMTYMYDNVRFASLLLFLPSILLVLLLLLALEELPPGRVGRRALVPLLSVRRPHPCQRAGPPVDPVVLLVDAAVGEALCLT